MAALADKQDLTESKVAESEKWIQGAVNPANKGGLHKALHVAQDKTIPKAKIAKATHSKNPKLRHMAQFAKNVANEGGMDKGILDPDSTEQFGADEYRFNNNDEEETMGEVGMTPKQRKFAKLAPPTGKITFADKIAGAKKEVDEMLGDVAAEAMKAAVGKGKHTVTDEGDVEDFVSGGGKITYGKAQKGPRKPGLSFGSKHIGGGGDKMKPSRTGRAANTQGKPVVAVEDEMDEGYAEMDAWMKSREKEKGTGKFDKKKISTGTVYTRKPETFDDPETDPEATGGAPKRRGRPMGKPKGPERTTKGAWKHKGARVQEDGEEKVCEHCGQPIVAEKAPPGAKAKRMVKGIKKSLSKDGKLSDKDKAIAYATTWKAKKAGKVEEEGAKPDFLDVDKDGNKKETFKKAVADKKEKKVDETTTSGSVATAPAAPKASKGMQFGKGVYEGLSSKLENMIAESMNVTVNMSTDEQGTPQKSITVTATDEDADKLAELLKMAGLGQNQQGSCGCGTTPCSCAEVVDENSPDWPTNTEKLAAQPELRTYSGGLNGPKLTGQTTVPVVASQLRRTSTMEENVELERSLFKTWKNYKG